MTNGLPDGVYSLADHAALAETVLPPSTLAYINGGSADEITLRANVRAWQDVALRPRALRDMTGAHTGVDVMGRRWKHPFFIAPMAHQRLVHPQGEQATTLAAAAQGTGLILSTQSSTDMETVASLYLGDPGRGALWFQLYIQHDRELTRELVRRAETSGYEALVVTVDLPVQAPRDRELRAGFRLPPHIRSVHLAEVSATAEPKVPCSDTSVLFQQHLCRSPTWSDIQWLQGLTRLPILLKGICHPDDAREALKQGCAGVIVSNHGGRALDTSPSTAQMLPGIAEALQGDLSILVDGGIRRGTDALKAIALGASAVGVGRPILHALATAGAMGVAHALRTLRDELEIGMVLTGCRNLAEAHQTLASRPSHPAHL